MMEIIKEIKNDLRNGYEYLEYWELINDYDWTFLIENDKILYYWIDEEYSFSGCIEVEKFIKLPNSDIINLINSDMYYNTQLNS